LLHQWEDVVNRSGITAVKDEQDKETR